MPARIKDHDSGTSSIRRIVRKETEEALEDLDPNRSLTDEAIHDARKRLKRARAALRLIRQGLGDGTYRSENRILRDASRPLSEIRDAKVLIEAFDDLVKSITATRRRDLFPMRAVLLSARRASRRRVLGGKSGLKPVRRALRSALRRSKDWRSVRGWSALGAGLLRVYTSGREAFAAAQKEPTVDHLHEWRKQAKYLWHQLEILEPLAPSRMKPMGDRAHQLSDHLGVDHDLAMLEMRLGAEGALVPSPALLGLLARIHGRRRRLQTKARILGGGVYSERPQEFVRRIEGYWRNWRSNQAN
jgi:CHAD domain-containing protein